MSTVDTAFSFSFLDIGIAVGAAIALFFLVSFLRKKNKKYKETPHVNTWIPYVGAIAQFGQNPVKFIEDNAKKVQYYLLA
jgi:hypothetical protein